MMQRPSLSRCLMLVTIAVMAAAGVFAAVSTVAARLARDEAGERPLVLFLHGRGQLGRDTAHIRREFQAALETGVGKLTSRSLLTEGDVRLVWYADVLDPSSSTGCEVTDRSHRENRANEPSQSSEDDGDVLQLLLGVTSALFTSLYESMPDDSRSSMRALVGDVLYLGDRWKRCGVERRLESTLAQAAREGRPVVLVAHSFGSLVAYSYLRGDHARSDRAPTVHRYVTLGSMLGIPELRELLLGRPGELTLPAGVRSWVNVRHVRDPFAAPLTDTTTRAQRGAPPIREVVTSGNAVDPHDIVSYLRDPAAARAIAWAWCDAGGKSHAPACADIARDVP